MSGIPVKKMTAEEIFRAHGGQLRMRDALALGISRYQLYALRDRGIIEPLTRGVYRLAELPAISNPDLVAVSLRFPQAVICLLSALAYHDLTTQIPHYVSIAISRHARIPAPGFPPVQAYKFSDAAFHAGIEIQDIDGVPVRIYSVEKTLADCFKYRNKLGMDVVQEALKLYKARKTVHIDALLAYARVCRVEHVMRPYLEAVL